MKRRNTRSKGCLDRPWGFARLLLLTLAAGSLLHSPQSLSGQIVEGYLNDARTRFAVGEVDVELRDSVGMVVARTTTNYLGAFRLTAPAPGRYSLLAKAMGYRSTGSESFEAIEGEVTTVNLFLPPEPMELDTLTVQTRRQRIVARLQDQGFYDRQSQGVGTFLTPEQISRWPAISVGDVLRHAPFVQIESQGVQGSRIFLNRFGRCEPTIYIDGNRIHDVEGNTPENWVRPEDIVAVEVYRGLAEIPLQWGMSETCGVILIWTKALQRGGSDNVGPGDSPPTGAPAFQEDLLTDSGQLLQASVDPRMRRLRLTALVPLARCRSRPFAG